jgi:hypothetical protein
MFDSTLISCQGILVLDDKCIEQTLWEINNVSISSMLEQKLKFCDDTWNIFISLHLIYRESMQLVFPLY